MGVGIYNDEDASSTNDEKNPPINVEDSDPADASFKGPDLTGTSDSEEEEARQPEPPDRPPRGCPLIPI